eukprot:7311909-Heterocapsa_arctica.AAC.1
MAKSRSSASLGGSAIGPVAVSAHCRCVSLSRPFGSRPTCPLAAVAFLGCTQPANPAAVCALSSAQSGPSRS